MDDDEIPICQDCGKDLTVGEQCLGDECEGCKEARGEREVEEGFWEK